MEVALCAGLTTVWWVSSASVLLPLVLLLKFNKTFRYKWFSWLFTKCTGPVFEPKLLPFRKQSFQLLEEHLKGRDITTPLDILEIGIGSGANLQFYPVNSRLTTVDMNESFESYFKENRKKYPQVKYEKAVIAMAEDMHEIPESSMDVVVSTYVLCSVESTESALREVKRVLKPGGKFLFLEHVAFPSSEWSYTVQSAVAPLWSLYFAGCCPHRDIAQQVNQAGFGHIFCQQMQPDSLMLFVRPHVMGIATK